MTVLREGLDLAVPHAEELFIGGNWQPPATAVRFAVVDPSNENVLAELPDVAPADIDKAVAAARAAFDEGPWPRLPMAERIARDRCESFVASALTEGASVACGGKRPAGLDRGWYFEPTLLTDVKNSMAVAREEVFGPVFTVLTYDDIDDAVQIANDSQYGLTAAMFTHDADLARSVGERLRVGSFTVNSTGGVLGQPFGGYKRSGLGREMGLEGFHEWTQTKVMKINATGNYLA